MELGPGDVVVGVSSRLIPEKGHADLIDAMARATRADRPAAPAGGGRRCAAGPTWSAQAASVLPPGSYRFLGFVDDIRSFMNAC